MPADPLPGTGSHVAPRVADAELIDDRHGVVLRRIVVGPLDTNCWVLHAVGSRAALMVDPGDEPERLLDAVVDLDITAVVLTHAHFDHVLAVPEVADAIGAPVLAHPMDQPVWPHELHSLASAGHFDAGTATAALLDAGCSLRLDEGRPVWTGRPDGILHNGDVLTVGPLAVRALHTPGHTPGSVSLAVPGHLLTGDTLFPGGPGLTGWPLSDFAQIMPSVRRLLDEPSDTHVHPGHGPNTTVGRERPSIDDWQRRGW